MIKVGIYGVSSQSGAAYFADFLREGVQVYGYARPSEHGRAVVDAIVAQRGIQVDRPENSLNETNHFVPLGSSDVGHDLGRLVDADLVLFAHPSVYHEESAQELAGYLDRRQVPLILSPSRTLAAPYVWRILGDGYPLISFQTCPYACKVFRPGSVFIKRRKRAWIASAEGRVDARTIALLRNLLPNIILSRTPAVTSLGNIGAVFHPTPYILNAEAIDEARQAGRVFSFYKEGISENAVVGPIVEEVDRIRLRIAARLGCSVFGLAENPREEEWRDIMARVECLEENAEMDVRERRRRRAGLLQPIHDSVVSAQHWLHYTYGIERIPGESLPAAIGRTPNLMNNSFPQSRYADEDVATGLVPLEALARRLQISCKPITKVIDTYNEQTGRDARATGRNLRDFDLAYLHSYLVGEQEWLERAC